MDTCPKCGSLCTVPIIYGKPGPQLERAAARGLVALGGCIVEPSSHTRRCLDCNVSWQSDTDTARLLDMLKDGLGLMHKHQYSLSNLVSWYGSACIAYGRSLKQESDNGAEYTQMMDAHAAISQEWSRFFLQVERLASSNYFNGRDLGLWHLYP